MSKLKTLILKLEAKKNSKLILFLFFIIFFLSSSFIAVVFSEYPEFDELAYIEHVETIENSENNWYLGDRNRMPLFNYILFTSYINDINKSTQYRIFQFTNIIFVLIFSFIYVKKLNTFFISKTYFFCCVAFTLFIPVISYIHDVVVEPLFYITYGLFCLYVKDLLENPNIYKYFNFGIIASILYLLKATGLNIFILSILFIALINILKKGIEVKNVFKNLIVSLLIFLLICSPYLKENYEKFDGHLFYNVNTTFYIWYDSWSEVESGTKLYGDRVGWPEMSDEEIPSLINYINEHTFSEIINRFSKGFKSIIAYYFSIKEFTGALTLSTILLICLLQHSKKSIQSSYKITIKNNNFKLYILFNSLILFVGAAWYSVIAPIPRFTILIIIPVYFLIFKNFDDISLIYSNRSKEHDLLIIFFIFLITQGIIIFNQI